MRLARKANVARHDVRSLTWPDLPGFDVTARGKHTLTAHRLHRLQDGLASVLPIRVHLT